LFILNNDGTCVAECPLDAECTVEFADFVSAVGESPLEDGRMFYVGEHSATIMHGRTLSLVAISKGRPGPDELSWSKGVLFAVEGYMTAGPQIAAEKGETAEEERQQGPATDSEEEQVEEEGMEERREKKEKKEEKDDEPPLPTRPTAPALPPDASVSEREAALMLRESELADAEEKAWRAIVRESEMKFKMEDLKQKLADVESQAKIDKRRLERELERLKDELTEKKKH
jgi:hypothetical protein